ncbi:hypothetical protein G6F31_019433 [Rhizopus arrhizus]|nr:hypothetical protein G6F31_019433 [Rhizopus arrhizus]
MTDRYRLDGRTSLVTGGSRGIGAATARALALLGSDVAISYTVNKDRAEALAAEIAAGGPASGPGHANLRPARRAGSQRRRLRYGRGGKSA